MAKVFYQFYKNSHIYRNGLDRRTQGFPIRSGRHSTFRNKQSVYEFFLQQYGQNCRHKNPEGKTVQKNVDWHRANGTYTFSYALGTVIVIIGLLTLLGIWSPKIGLVGGLLTFGMSIVTLSFLITTPEVYVPNLGGDFPTPQYGFPYLSGAGRLVLKDIIMMAGGLIAASDAAQRILKTK